MAGIWNGHFVLGKTLRGKLHGQGQEGAGRWIQRSGPKPLTTEQNLEEEAHSFV